MELSEKSPATRTHSEAPLNVETPACSLRESFVTPVERFFVRSHGSLPRVDAGDHSLEVSGLVERPSGLALRELKRRFPKREMAATLHCAGNRRAELMRVRDIPGETPWDIGAIGNARWAGVSLRELLLWAGVGAGTAHVAFTGLDEVELGSGTTYFGGSIPIQKALSGDVILAYEMNGEPLAAAHGYPLRAVVAGYVGARSVKWLSGIELRSGPSANYYQTHEYRLYPRDRAPGEPDPSEGEALGELSVNAAICRPTEGELVPGGPVRVAGYAITGGRREIESVEVSADGGETWERATLKEGDDPRSWRFWEASVETGGTTVDEIVVRARDTAGGIQPVSPRQTWNPKGYVNDAYHRVTVRRAGA